MDPERKVTLDAIRSRDPEAVAALVRRHHRGLRGYVAALSANLDHVDDLAQEVFLRALQRLDRVQDLEAFDLFLRAIARNVVHEHARHRARSGERYIAFIEDLYAAAPPEPAETSSAVRALRGCLEQLPPRSRRLLDLRYSEEHQAEIIGREMQMSAGAVRVLLLRVRESLLKCIRAATGGGPAFEVKG